jgi:hypothetical protein
LALDTTIGPGISSGEHRANYTAIQSTVNDIIAVLSAGTSGAQYFNGNGSSVTFVSGPTPSFSTTLPTATDGAEAVHVDSISAPTHMWRLRYVAAALTWYPQAGSWGYGTSLPSVPSFVDRVRFTLVDSVTAPTYQWEFQYNLGSASSYKWEFVGGVPAHAFESAAQDTASTSYADLSTVGPSFTVARAGDYDFEWYVRASNSVAATRVFAGISISGSVQEDAVSLSAAASAGNADDVGLALRYRHLAVAAAAPSKLQYKVGAGTGTFADRHLYVTPVRVI